MKVSVKGTDQVIEVEGLLAPGDILMFISTMAVIAANEAEDTAEVMLVSTSATGVKTSKLFGKVEPVIVEEEEEDDN